MFRGDGSANFSANTLPEMVLPMSLQLGLTDAGRNESQADIRLLIAQFCSVNLVFLSDRAQSHSTVGGRQAPAQILAVSSETHFHRNRVQPAQLPTGIKQYPNFTRIDREILRDLRHGKAHTGKGP
jgi:hypothetical protein